MCTANLVSRKKRDPGNEVVQLHENLPVDVIAKGSSSNKVHS